MSTLQPFPSFITQMQTAWPFAQSLAHCQLAWACFQPQPPADTELSAWQLATCKGNSKRQAEFLAGRFCAMQASHQLGLAAQPPSRDEQSGRPLWPDQVCGSISHSKGIAAAVVALDSHWSGLGLDLERCMPPERARRLRTAILTPAEQHWLDGISDKEAGQRLTLLFSAKESLFKALHPLSGQYFGFQDAEVTECSSEQLQLQLLRDLAGGFAAGSVYQGFWTTLNDSLLTLVALPRKPSALSN